MSDGVIFERRDFLKLVGVGLAGAATAGCAAPRDKLIPYLVAPEDTLPGVPLWYASTCRECPSGCGVLIKAREGRAIKIEGNPDHPVNQGRLCARGQASLQGHYDPDRLRQPMQRSGNDWKPITWDAALQLAGTKLAEAKGGVALVTDHQPGSFAKLAREWASAMGGTHLVYEPFAYESLREANRRSFGDAAMPSYDLGAAKMIVSFGADFLETFLSPTAQNRGFAAARAGAGMAHFVAVEPRLSLTGANADEWIAVRPGSEMALALGMAHVIVREGLSRTGGEALREALAPWTPEAVSQQTDVPAGRVQHLAQHFIEAAPSVAIAGGVATQSEQSVGLLMAVNLLNWLAGNVGRTVKFDRSPNWDGVGSFADLQNLIAGMNGGAVKSLVVHGANPAYAVPAWAGFGDALAKVPFKLAISETMNETAAACDLVLPASHAIESWGDAESARGVTSLIQPAMRTLPMFDSRPAGDILMALGKGAGVGATWPETWLDYLKAQWRGRVGGDFDGGWASALQKGGIFEESAGRNASWTGGSPDFLAPQLKGAGEYAVVLYPSPSLYDGRGANKPWLQEVPDPTTKAVWSTWVELHPETAKKLGVSNGDAVKVETDGGSIEVPAYVYSGIRKDTIAIPLGQGHTAYGRYAKDLGANALALLSPAQDQASGALAYLSMKARLSKSAKPTFLAVSQKEKNQHDRGIAQIVPLAALMATGTAATNGHAAEGHVPADTTRATAEAHGGAEAHHGHQPYPMHDQLGKNTEPMERPADWKPPAHAVSAYEPDEKGRHPRREPARAGNYGTAKHRWAMAIDLHSCTGCSACVVACYAENNIPTVGPELVKRGREMSWIRIERFEEKLDPANPAADVRHIPMLCQHCTDAPCEMVCPVYATYHNPEGLNAQVYNRCVGTRYCSNNCPYKVRAFNFFDYSAPEKPTFAFPEPLNWQLNPDVTVRSKGVMEKCTFCVQRILESKGVARDEGRELRDGDIQVACAQTCPTNAIVFGDLLDPNSRVAQLSYGSDRRYWVLNELNTKPAITYLKKVSWHEEEHA